MSKKPNWIYLCMHLYTCVYSACNREVVGSSPTRDEIFSKNRFGALFMAHTYTHIIYIYIYQLFALCLECLPMFLCILGNTQ